jgi:antitoxin component HigA of HigAB toxin-antitoxin module
MPPKIIRDDDEYKFAMAEVGRLWDAEDGSEAAAELEHWGLLVEAYESVQPGPVDPVSVIRAEMEMNGRTRADLAAIIGENRATEILSRKRALTLPMIRDICAAWRIPADLLIADYETVDAKPRKSA